MACSLLFTGTGDRARNKVKQLNNDPSEGCQEY